MSTDWNIRCVECNDVHRYRDANHCEQLMQLLIANRDAIAALEPLFAASRHHDVRLEIPPYGDIEPCFFAAHRGPGHTLVPHDEYGHDLGCPWATRERACTCPNIGASAA